MRGAAAANLVETPEIKGLAAEGVGNPICSSDSAGL